MPREGNQSELLLDIADTRSRCEQLAQTPFDFIGKQVLRLLNSTSFYAEGWQSEDAQWLLRYESALLDKLPIEMSERFVFDYQMIRSITDAWDSGGVVTMSHAIIPAYGQQWQFDRWPILPMGDPGQALSAQFLTIHGSDSLIDIDLRDYPPMFHELLHSLFHQQAARMNADLERCLKPVIDELSLAQLSDRRSLKDAQSRRTKKIRTLWWPSANHRNWSHELAIDVMSLAIVGPAYANWFLRETEQQSNQAFDVLQSHPPFYVRAQGLGLASDRLGFDLGNEIRQRLGAWDEQIGVKPNEFLSAAHPDLISAIVGTAIDAVRSLRIPAFSWEQWLACQGFVSSAADASAPAHLISAAWHAASALDRAAYHTWLDLKIGQVLGA